MNPGLYEKLISIELDLALAKIPQDRVVREALDPESSHTHLSQYLEHVISRSFARVSVEDQIELCNRLIDQLAKNSSEDRPEMSRVIAHSKPQLMAIQFPPEAGIAREMVRPETPLSISCLLTGTRADPSLVSQIQSELKTSDRVDILCSFIKWSGIRVLESELREFTSKPENCLRIITTSYMGATDIKAVEFLRQLPNTHIKVSYDTKRTRLHAKSYTFHRNTGFGTSYIGSSNLSHAAITDGLEWNIKVSQYESEHLWNKMTATFETYWNDTEEFSSYTENDVQQLRTALEQEVDGQSTSLAYFFDIRPYPFQQEILDRIQAERLYLDRSRHLIVAATGTGKTVIAALDYKHFRHARMADGKTARLLFVAHRKEILEQSIACFRAVLRDQNFGNLHVGPHTAKDRSYLFTSIQSYNTQQLWADTYPDYYDYVVIDESHHVGAAKMYKELVNHIQPQVLLGLTATPERGDGQSILDVFGGQITAEIRLPDAINRKLLSPFQYFGITDTVNLDHLKWRRGGYAVEDLEALYADNIVRAQLIVDKTESLLLDPRKARGLGFCVSIKHAQFMTKVFSSAGIPSLSLSSQSTDDERAAARGQLISRDVNFLFVVDLYNEGVDLPELDTVLFLRPTESLTVFLQQLGRGLRLSEDKDYLTILDFVGQANHLYNYESRFRALMDHPKRRLDQEILDNSLPLPAGCTITLEKLARQYILDNITRAITGGANALLQRLRSFETDTGHAPTLAGFLDYYEMEPDDLYRRYSWTQLRERAGIYAGAPDKDAEDIANRLRMIEHISGPSQLRRMHEIISEKIQPSCWDERDERLLLMFHVSLWGPWKPQSLEESLERLYQNPAHYQEILDLLRYQRDKTRSVAPNVCLPFLCPLELHSAYTRDEILSGLGYWTLQSRTPVQSGVLHLPLLPADLFFITLNKTEKEYSPTTMYADYAISDRLFHWQSQSTTSDTSPTGKRYIDHEARQHTLLLFVRENKIQDNLAQPYYFLGPARYLRHTGSRPMSVELELEHAIPAWYLSVARRSAIN